MSAIGRRDLSPEQKKVLRMLEKERAFTEDTVYLVHKWYLEGCPIKTIADVMNRSVDNIMKALATPLSEAEEEMLKEYMVRRED